MGLSSFLSRVLVGLQNLVSSRDLQGIDQSPPELVVLGLGNPGIEYEKTRHNIGYEVVNTIVERHGTGEWVDRGDSLEHAATVNGRPIVLALPLTFMNRSGDAAGAVLERNALGIDDLLVIVDDVDLPLGRLRLKASGGPGTHNGLRDIVKVLGPGFKRLRVGIKGADLAEDLAQYVLSSFDDHEMPLVEESLQRAADGVESVAVGGVQQAMGAVNRRSGPPPRSP